MTTAAPADAGSHDAIASRAEQLFAERYLANLKRTDRLFAFLLVAQWVFALVLAVTYSPYTWAGRTRAVNLHVEIALILGALITVPPVLLALKRPGATVTRYAMAVAQMAWSALLIHLTGGRIETHFHVFGSLAFLAFYRDWRVLIPATVLVALDHLLRQIFWPESVFGIVSPETWRFLEHAGWVVFEDVFLIISCVAGVREMRSIAAQQARIELGEQLEQEMQIATRIQTAILPREPEVRGLQIAATMIPASEVGGDYYDVIPVDDGCWLGIGDVAGHGLVAGLFMLQAQAAIKALVTQDCHRSPREVLADVNRVLFDNVRRRLGHDEHMTMSLIRYHDDGRVVIAGAHQTLLICRASTGRCERHRAPGTWLGLVEDIAPFTDDLTYRLGEGDTLVLFTDGLTEAMNAEDTQFGLDRLCSEVERSHGGSVAHIRDRLLASVADWAKDRRDDDVTLLIVRQASSQAAEAA